MLSSLKKRGILLEKTTHGFENLGVLNPAVLRNREGIHMWYRAISKTHSSVIGYARFDVQGQLLQRDEIPSIYPQASYECHGVEDPRIVMIEGLFYLTYTAFDGLNARGALAISSDMIHWEKQGLIVADIRFADFILLAESNRPLNEKYHRYNQPPQGMPDSLEWKLWDKNVILFPRRIHGKLYLLHRIKPDIQLVIIQDFSDLTTAFWENYFLHFTEGILLSPKYDHEVSYVGGGCPPIETEIGWLLIYHGVHDTLDGYVYSACAALLDLENPKIERGRLPYPLFGPEYEYEVHGIINNICFPSGAVVVDELLYIFYGAADKRIAWVTLSLPSLLEELQRNPLETHAT
jgi:beta-1,2-mannobiose phosphorylase / 1,2-beta-oligomannan phosphorylase